MVPLIVNQSQPLLPSFPIYKDYQNQLREYYTRILVLKPSLLLPDPSDKFCLAQRIPFPCCISLGWFIEFLVRIKEHHWSVITGDCDSSALAEHAWTSHHHIAWGDATILHQHQRWFQRCILESWYIHQVPNLLNRDSGNLPQPYWAVNCDLTH